MPIIQFSLKLSHASPSKAIEFNTFLIIKGLKTFNSKWPLLPPTVTATLFPKTYAHTIVIASHYVGFTFPGMIEEPGSFSGSDNSPSPHRGPEPKNLISLAIFISDTANEFRAALKKTKASLLAKASNLFGEVIN